jgi:hypothetical protein
VLIGEGVYHMIPPWDAEDRPIMAAFEWRRGSP